MPLIIPARQRALDAFPRSVPWILWVSIMHVCYIFLRDILIFILDGTNGSLPEYVRAIATDTALSEDVVPLLVLGRHLPRDADYLWCVYCPSTSADGALPEVGYKLPQVLLPYSLQGLSFPRTWAVLGLMGLLAVFVVVTASLERTARLLGRNRGDDVARFSEKTTTSAP